MSFLSLRRCLSYVIKMSYVIACKNTNADVKLKRKRVFQHFLAKAFKYVSMYSPAAACICSVKQAKKKKHTLAHLRSYPTDLSADDKTSLDDYFHDQPSFFLLLIIAPFLYSPFVSPLIHFAIVYIMSFGELFHCRTTYSTLYTSFESWYRINVVVTRFQFISNCPSPYVVHLTRG